MAKSFTHGDMKPQPTCVQAPQGFKDQENNNKTTINANVKQQPFTQEVLMKNTYKIMKKANPNPSCKPSNSIKHHFAKK